MSKMGFGGFMGLAEQVSYDTPVTPSTHWLPLVSHTVGERRDIRELAHLHAMKAAPAFHDARDVAEFGIDVGGDITWIPSFDHEATALMLKHFFGSVATTGSGPYTHTFDWDLDGVSGLTGQEFLPHASLDEAEVFTGLVLNTLELSANARGEIVAKAGAIGRSAGGFAAVSGTPSYPLHEEMLAHMAADVSWASATHRFTQWSLRADKKLSTRYAVGSKYTVQPQPAGSTAEVTFSGRVEVDNHDLYDAFRANTQGNLVVTITGTGNNALVCTLRNFILRKCDKPVDRVGVLSFDVEGRAFANISSGSLTMALTNDNASAV